jgi:cystathionine beta-lyase/cystathionine gamma-synthase
MFKKIVIIGLGLMGGSLAAACRKKFPRARIVGISRSYEALALAKRKKWVHESTREVLFGAQGADLVVYSATKYLAGHNDVVAGAVITRTPELSERVAFLQNAVGSILGPQDAWLTLRGLKTLALRVARQQENALAVAEWLCSHPHVNHVYYPGFPDHPGRDILLREKSGWGGMIAFEVDDPARVPSILASVRVFLFAESLGGVESLITYPAVQTHADIDAETRQRLGINDRLLRLSVGIEDLRDLICDLENVL